MKSKKIYVKVFITVLLCVTSFEMPFCQSLDTNLREIKQFNESVKKIKQTLGEVSVHFRSYNEASKDSANFVLSEILKLSESLRGPRNEFLYRTFLQLEEDQRLLVKKYIVNEINSYDLLYNELVSIYGLNKHYSRVLSLIDTNAFANIKGDFISKSRITDNGILQLKYYSTLANIGKNERFEKDLLLLVKSLYKIAKKEKNQHKSNNLLITFYNRILPNSVGKLLSKNSVVESLYLMEEPTRIKSGHDVADSNLAWSYVNTCVLSKLKYADEKYWNLNVFYKRIDEIKDEILNDNTIWHDHIKTGNE